IRLENVVEVEESGLTGIALHPAFISNQLLYLYYTYRDGEDMYNRVSQFRYTGDTLEDEQIIIDSLPGGIIHNGGRIRFDDQNKLWVLTGDAGDSSIAQNLDSLGGKILRLNEDGSVPEDNPIPDSMIYSYGHRNPQGIDWNDQGDIIATEHGWHAYDEINLIIPGGNYGWPEEQQCLSETEEFINPVLCSFEDTWAPSGGAFIKSEIDQLKDSYFFAGLKGSILKRIDIVDGEVQFEENILTDVYGRLRAVTASDDGSLYVSTSNLDGRGDPRQGDDKIIKLTPILN
ncbi:MAG: PQQ-dependent sugar dehydrogenase, partial [Nitrososphaeraceae archaeon]|nr:PQQ-dependent sugar dehydrogenase [Nitrososphaeraceae archaeon]